MLQTPTEQPAKSIATTLSQMTLYVPGLGRLLQDWPRGANPNIETARAEAEKLLEMYVAFPTVRNAAKSIQDHRSSRKTNEAEEM